MTEDTTGSAAVAGWAEAPTQPLAGIRVLDLTTFLSGPSATQMLGDLGAEIIKVESPQGDSSRSIPPHFVGDDSAYYLASNRNKRSIVVDLKNPEGLAVVKRLAGECDVLIENFRPGVCARLGLAPGALTAANPRLVWASISGFGQVGPLRERPAYDMIVQAMSGVMSVTGHPGGPATRLGIPAGDVIAGMYAVVGVLSALLARERTGRGDVIDIAMLDGQISQLSYQAVYTLLSGKSPKPQGARHDSIPTYRAFTGGDGREFVVTANTQQMWERMARVAGLESLLADSRFADERGRLAHRDDLWGALEVAFAEKPAEEWVELLVAANVPAAPVLDVSSALDQARHSGRGLIVELDDDQGHSIDSIGTPIRFPDRPAPPRRYPPRLGQDTRAVLHDVLGLDEHEIARLLDCGALRGEVTSPDLAPQH
ncbi:CaiB/BaiF CoA transferase family protein [Mycolicibacterium murale]|uniref:CaiB/BaiF CoA transferase family protein n=1 Tax=Mycolicibacterium murale TaxID=182220 RepID=UPI001FE528D7|nr:CaiB/BaiF CoA-transferase family protein [Mycolicibacterium murale]